MYKYFIFIFMYVILYLCFTLGVLVKQFVIISQCTKANDLLIAKSMPRADLSCPSVWLL